MFDDLADMIPVPDEQTEVIFTALDLESGDTAVGASGVAGEPKRTLRAGWFLGLNPKTDDTDALASIPIDDSDEEWTG